jgi:hypothetical protein
VVAVEQVAQVAQVVQVLEVPEAVVAVEVVEGMEAASILVYISTLDVVRTDTCSQLLSRFSKHPSSMIHN